VRVPTLLVHGLQDKVVPPEVSRTMVNLLPDAGPHVFARCGHWTQIERAAGFNAQVGDFLGRERDSDYAVGTAPRTGGHGPGAGHDWLTKTPPRAGSGCTTRP